MQPEIVQERQRLLHAIRHWNIAAESENTTRYFYRFDEVSEVESGEVSVVIGHKGTGKSAIAEWINNINTPEKSGRSLKLSLTDFDVELLYSLSESQPLPFNRYATLWSYVIVSAVCNLMRDDPTIDREQLHKIRKKFKREFRHSSFELAEIVSRGIAIKIPLLGITIGARQAKSPTERIRDYADTVRRFSLEIRNVYFHKPYYVIFDELDEDYYDIVGNTERFDSFRTLIVGLVRATRKLGADFAATGHPVRPIIMIRKDIFEAIHFNDMGKIAHKVRDVSWTRPRLHRMLAFRIARALQFDIEPDKMGGFSEEWHKLFNLDDFSRHSCDVERLFNYVFNRSFLRPRDFIAFLQAGATVAFERAAAGGDPVMGLEVRDIVEAERRYSEYLRQEVEDAMVGIHPDLPESLNVLSDMRKKIVSYDELRAAVLDRSSQSLQRVLNPDKIIETLFYFNVVGRHHQKYDGTFAYHRQGDKVAKDWSFIVHRGFWRGFNLTKGDFWELKSAIRCTR